MLNGTVRPWNARKTGPVHAGDLRDAAAAAARADEWPAARYALFCARLLDDKTGTASALPRTPRKAVGTMDRGDRKPRASARVAVDAIDEISAEALQREPLDGRRRASFSTTRTGSRKVRSWPAAVRFRAVPSRSCSSQSTWGASERLERPCTRRERRTRRPMPPADIGGLTARAPRPAVM